MLYRNILPNSIDDTSKLKKRTLLINKLHKTESISNILKKRKTLFDNPETYLKLPSETNFQFIIGKKLRGPRYNSDNELIPYSIVGQIAKKEKKFW